jgi:hypothetical protein
VFTSGNMLYYSDLARSFTTIASGANMRVEGHLYVFHGTKLTLGLTRYRSHAVLFARTEQPHHAPEAPATSFLPRPSPLPSTQRHSSTSAFTRPA